MINCKVIPVESVYGNTGLYLVVLGYYRLALLGIRWYRVCEGLLCLYISKTLPKALRTQPLTALTSNFGLVGLVRWVWLGRFGLVGLVW